MQQTALIAMSGGVDSSTVAALMREQGYKCIGCILRLYSPEEECNSRPSGTPQDIADAQNVADKLGMQLLVLDCRDEFREQVIGYFANSYAQGLTPNPCIECNRRFKFPKLFDLADKLGCDVVATGHYARVEEVQGEWQLRRALDSNKDQSYVLYNLTPAQLQRLRLPLGALNKSETRTLAQKYGLVNAYKTDSQDICFVPHGDYAKIVNSHLQCTLPSGDFVDNQGKILGRHRGIIHYTIGQHRGLGLGLHTPHYVCAIDAHHNRVVLGTSDELFKRQAQVEDCNWTLTKIPTQPIRCLAKVRYRQTAQPCTVTAISENRATLLFDEPQRAIAPGQAAVWYDGERVLGGGRIGGSGN